MKIALALLALAVVASGCVIVHPRSASRATVSSAKCPPGHVWSDGECHARGKGHDR